MATTLDEATSAFGAAVKAKLTSPAARGEPEDQLRGPFEAYVEALAELCGLEGAVATSGARCQERW